MVQITHSKRAPMMTEATPLNGVGNRRSRMARTPADDFGGCCQARSLFGAKHRLSSHRSTSRMRELNQFMKSDVRRLVAR